MRLLFQEQIEWIQASSIDTRERIANRDVCDDSRFKFGLTNDKFECGKRLASMTTYSLRSIVASEDRPSFSSRSVSENVVQTHSAFI